MPGEVRHLGGTVVGQVPASRDGRVLYIRTLPRVFTGDFLAYVIEIAQGD